MPDISFDEGHVNGNTFAITENSQNVNFSVDEAHNAILLSVDNITASYRSNDFYYRKNVIVKAKE